MGTLEHVLKHFGHELPADVRKAYMKDANAAAHGPVNLLKLIVKDDGSFLNMILGDIVIPALND